MLYIIWVLCIFKVSLIKQKMKKRAILYLGGGGMMGLWGAGVLTKLQNLKTYDKIERVYACSAGVFNGCYFLTKQMEKGSSIYYEDLPPDFINVWLVPYGALQRIINGYIKKIKFSHIANVMNLNKLIDVARNRKKLDVQKLKYQKVPLYVKVLDTKDNGVKYLDIRKGDVFKLMKASCSSIPYYFPNPEEENYIDAAIKEPLGIRYLIKKYPKQKIVVIFNLSTKRNLWHYIKNFIEGFVANSMYKGVFSNFIRREKDIRESIKIAKKNKNILFISPKDEENISSWEMNPLKLKKAYRNGMKHASKIAKFLK